MWIEYSRSHLFSHCCHSLKSTSLLGWNFSTIPLYVHACSIFAALCGFLSSFMIWRNFRSPVASLHGLLCRDLHNSQPPAQQHSKIHQLRYGRRSDNIVKSVLPQPSEIPLLSVRTTPLNAWPGVRVSCMVWPMGLLCQVKTLKSPSRLSVNCSPIMTMCFGRQARHTYIKFLRFNIAEANSSNALKKHRSCNRQAAIQNVACASGWPLPQNCDEIIFLRIQILRGTILISRCPVSWRYRQRHTKFPAWTAQAYRG